MSLYPSKPFTISLDRIPKSEQVLEVLRKFREMNPWKGSPKERHSKFEWLHNKLNEIYGLQVKFKDLVTRPYRSSGASNYSVLSNTITLVGRYSVITFLHEWGHALEHNGIKDKSGKLSGEHWAVAFSVTLFKTVFPDKFEKLRVKGHMLIKRSLQLQSFCAIFSTFPV